jgi:hypothetical protein
MLEDEDLAEYGRCVGGKGEVGGRAEDAGRGGNSCEEVPLGVPLVVGLLGAVCGRRGATCSITLGGSCIRGCLLASTSSRIFKICWRKSASRSTSAETALVPFRYGDGAAAVDIEAIGAAITTDESWILEPTPTSERNIGDYTNTGETRG